MGYDRLEGFEEQALLTAAYEPLVPLLNFFMSSQKTQEQNADRLKRNQSL
jgi:hypothetical protein